MSKQSSGSRGNRYAVLISKDFSNKGISKESAVEAIMHQIKKVPTIKSINYLNGMFIVNDNQEIELTKNISCVMKDVKYDNNSNEKRLLSLSIELYSETFTVPKIITYIEKIIDDYTTYIQNDLGNNLYYFTQMNMNDPLKYKNGQQEPSVVFTKNVFTTYRNFANVYFEKKEELVERIDFFLNNLDWYKRQGIAHTLGFMFYGHPGCGKTSSIKALANIMQRHIININLSEIKTNTQLKNLFYNEELIIDCGSDDKGHKRRVLLNIPIAKRIYVFEDIDCAGDIVNKRSENVVDSGTGNEYAPGGAYYKGTTINCNRPLGMIDESETDPITLSSLLNILDGTLEIPDRVIIITTNHPEKLDSALIRPGRIDVTVEFKYATQNTIKEMVESFFEKKLDKKIIGMLPDGKISPAQVNTILLKNFKNHDAAVAELLELVK